MRILMKISIPVEKGNETIKDGTLGPKMRAIAGHRGRAKARSGIFRRSRRAHDGLSTGFIVVNIGDASQIPALAEPRFLSFNANVELHPAMTFEDLGKAGPAMEAAVKKLG